MVLAVEKILLSWV